MEAYKTINRELTVKNQELRQYVGALRDELTILKQKLLAEREGQQEMKRSVVKIVTKALKMVLQLLFPESVENDLSNSISMIGSKINKSAKLTPSKHPTTNNSENEQTLTKSPGFLRRDNESRSPLADIQRNFNVTQRNRRGKEYKAEETVSLPHEELEEAEEDCNDEFESRVNLSLAAIIEEATLSPRTKSGTSDKNLNSDDEDNETFPDISNISDKRSTRIYRRVTENSKQKLGTSFSSYVEESASLDDDNPDFQESLKRSRESRDNSLNETSFNSLSIMKATSSTPFKHPPKSKVSQNVKVCIPRLRPEIISRLTLSVNETAEKTNLSASESSKEFNSKSKKSAIKSTAVDAKSPTMKRPKRKAAAVNLAEPPLKSKLRRPF